MSTYDYAIAPPGRFASVFPFALGALVLVALGVALVGTPDLRQAAVGGGVALVIVVPVVAALAWDLRHPRVRLRDGVLVVGRLPRVRVPARDFLLDGARVVDLERERGLRPFLRLIGTRLPGFQAGWFYLRGGGTGFALVSDPHRVLYLPRHDRSPLLLSVERPDALLDALRRARG